MEAFHTALLLLKHWEVMSNALRNLFIFGGNFWQNLHSFICNLNFFMTIWTNSCFFNGFLKKFPFYGLLMKFVFLLGPFDEICIFPAIFWINSHFPAFFFTKLDFFLQAIAKIDFLWPLFAKICHYFCVWIFALIFFFLIIGKFKMESFF